MDVKIIMKIKIVNSKVKKRFLQISSCLLTCALLMVSVAIPAWADKGKVFREIFGDKTGTELVEIIFPPEKQKQCAGKAGFTLFATHFFLG